MTRLLSIKVFIVISFIYSMYIDKMTLPLVLVLFVAFIDQVVLKVVVIYNYKYNISIDPQDKMLFSTQYYKTL
jgi:hypothetical protein